MKKLQITKIYLIGIITLGLAACGGGGGGGPSSHNNSSNTAPIAQSFNFSQTGTIELVTGETLANPATGQGSGATTYTSSNIDVAPSITQEWFPSKMRAQLLLPQPNPVTLNILTQALATR